MSAEFESPAITPIQRDVPFVFTGEAGEYFRIWIVNVVLSLLTLGVYSAWAKKRTRQYFYRHTQVDGTGFEYLADPIQILKGRVVLVLLLGCLVALQAFDPVLYLVGVALFMVASPALLVAALRFNARQSAWRNVRFRFDAPISVAYQLYAKMVGLTLVTCGFAVPYTQWMWADFIASNHRFGDQPFSWRTQPGEIVTLYIYMVPMMMAVYALFFVGILCIATLGQLLPTILGTKANDPATMDQIVSMASIIGLPLFYAALTVPSAFFKARMANLFFGGMSVGPHTVRSEQRFAELLRVYLGNLVALVLSLGLAWPWAKVRLTAYRLSRLTLVAHGPLVVDAGEGADHVNALGDAAMDLGELDLDLGF